MNKSNKHISKEFISILKSISKVSLLLAFSFFLLASSCSEEPQENLTLPPITTTGENTFGCLIDGHRLIPRDGTGTFMGPDHAMNMYAGGVYPDYSYQRLHVRNFISNNGILKLHFDNGAYSYGTGDFDINESNGSDDMYANENINIRCRWNNQWYSSIENAGIITFLKNDIETSIIAATFSCTVQNEENPNDIIEITDGRFDIHLPTLASTNFP